MDIDRNMKDFEKELEQMKVYIVDMEPCIDDAILETLKNVIDEYECHLRTDITELVEKVEELEEKALETDNIE